MSEYGQPNQNPTPFITDDFVQERRAARRKLIEEVEQRRKTIYIRWYKKMRLKTASEPDTLA